MGLQAGQYTQGIRAIAIGCGAAFTQQGSDAIAIGTDAGASGQSGLAIGYQAGQYGQTGIAIGSNSGQYFQKPLSVAFGARSGETNQATGAIAIGYIAGRTNQGLASVCIGWGASSTFNNSIVISGVGNTANLNSNKANATFIRPIRGDGTAVNDLYYDPATYEVYYLTSSQKYKNNIKTLIRNFDDVLNLRSVEYNFKDTNSYNIGYIAEEVYGINKDFATLNSQTKEPVAIYWHNITLYQNEIIKRHDKEIKDLRNEIEILKNNIL